MKQLTSNDLMVGDYIKYMFLTTRINDAEQLFHISESNETIEPIPITPEILENNGFTIGMYSYCYIGEEEYLEYYRHKSRLSLYWKGVDEWESHTIQKELLGRCNVVYVHELQHALRMFGIKKEIKL